MDSLKEIVNPWVVYSNNHDKPTGIGRIVNDYGKFGDITHSEKGPWPSRLQLWNLKGGGIKRFETYQEAIDYFLENSNKYTREELEEEVQDNFSSLFSQTQLKRTHKATS